MKGFASQFRYQSAIAFTPNVVERLQERNYCVELGHQVLRKEHMDSNSRSLKAA